jgi:GNAT superfamily N-acetyltransferase
LDSRNLRVIDLKENRELIVQYMELRNQYADLLLTDKVEREGTMAWLDRDDHVAIGLADGDSLAGVVVLYFNRNGEVALFSRRRPGGLGSRLLALAEEAALRRGLSRIWAWVRDDNRIAQNCFLKNGFSSASKVTRVRGKSEVHGVMFEKQIMKAGQ